MSQDNLLTTLSLVTGNTTFIFSKLYVLGFIKEIVYAHGLEKDTNIKKHIQW